MNKQLLAMLVSSMSIIGLAGYNKAEALQPTRRPTSPTRARRPRRT